MSREVSTHWHARGCQCFPELQVTLCVISKPLRACYYLPSLHASPYSPSCKHSPVPLSSVRLRPFFLSVFLHFGSQTHTVQCTPAIRIRSAG
jgi:hypothetical protein